MVAQKDGGYSWGARISQRLIWLQEGITKEAKGWGVGGFELGDLGCGGVAELVPRD